MFREIPSVKGSLRRKIIISSIPTIAKIFLLTFIVYFDIFNFVLKQRLQLRITSLALTAAVLIDGEAHSRLATSADEHSIEYKEIQKVLQDFQLANTDIKEIYTMRLSGYSDEWEVVVDAKLKDPLHIGTVYDAAANDLLAQAYTGAVADDRLLSNLWGSGLRGYAPIKNSNGETVGVVGMLVSVEEIYNQIRKLGFRSVIIFIIAIGIISFVTSKLIRNFTQPIEEMTTAVNRFKAGDNDFRVNIQTGDELELLGNAFNAAADLTVDYQRMIERDLQNTKLQKEKIFNVYRDVIRAVTQGKFNLLNEQEFELLKSEGVFQEEVKITVPTDVNSAREAIASYMKGAGYSEQDIAHTVLCISEAATNVIKHAGHGRMRICALPQGVRVCVLDHGPGMDFDKLPNMIFLQGFSTKISMGCGFSIIYMYADKIYLATSEYGTQLAMDFQITIHKNKGFSLT